MDELELCWGPAMWQLWKTAGAPSAGRVELTLAELGGVTLGRRNGLVFSQGGQKCYSYTVRRGARRLSLKKLPY